MSVSPCVFNEEMAIDPSDAYWRDRAKRFQPHATYALHFYHAAMRIREKGRRITCLNVFRPDGDLCSSPFTSIHTCEYATSIQTIFPIVSSIVRNSHLPISLTIETHWIDCYIHQHGGCAAISIRSPITHTIRGTRRTYQFEGKNALPGECCSRCPQISSRGAGISTWDGARTTQTKLLDPVCRHFDYRCSDNWWQCRRCTSRAKQQV